MDALPAEVLSGIVGGAQADDRQTVDSETAIGLTVGPDAAGSDTTGPELQSATASVDAEASSQGGELIVDQPLSNPQPEDASLEGVRAIANSQANEPQQQVENTQSTSSNDDWFEADEPAVTQASPESQPKDLLEASHSSLQPNEDIETAQDDDTADDDHPLPPEGGGDTEAGWEFAEDTPADDEIDSEDDDKFVDQDSSQPDDDSEPTKTNSDDQTERMQQPVEKILRPLVRTPGLDEQKTREAERQHELALQDYYSHLSEADLERAFSNWEHPLHLLSEADIKRLAESEAGNKIYFESLKKEKEKLAETFRPLDNDEDGQVSKEQLKQGFVAKLNTIEPPSDADSLRAYWNTGGVKTLGPHFRSLFEAGQEALREATAQLPIVYNEVQVAQSDLDRLTAQITKAESDLHLARAEGNAARASDVESELHGALHDKDGAEETLKSKLAEYEKLVKAKESAEVKQEVGRKGLLGLWKDLGEIRGMEKLLKQYAPLPT